MPLATPTQTRIYNRALAALGSTSRVTNADESTTIADTLNEHWPTAARAALAEHPWNFALKRALLNRGSAPAFGGGYTYKLPSDCLRWLPFAKDSEHYVEAVEEAGFLLADGDATLPIRYIFLNEDVSSWSPHFVDLMGMRLAMDAAEALHSISGEVRDLAEKYEAALVKAKRADGLATGDRERGSITTQSRALDAAFSPVQTYYVPGLGYRS